MPFGDDEFDKAVKDAECCDLTDWEFFTETNGVKIYRFYCSQSKLYEYKVFGIVDVKPALCAAVYQDIAYRKEWDSYVKELTHIRKTDPEIIYWEVAFPWPMSNRDYVFLRQSKKCNKNERDTWITLGRSAKANELTERQTVDEKKGVIRVTDYKQTMVIADDGNGSTKIYMHYYDDPKGMIPSMLINWAAKTGVPSFMATLLKACQNYQKPISV